MAINSQKQAAKKFVEYWTFNRPGSEKSGCQQYWNMLLRELLGQTEIESVIRYEVPVKLPTTNHQPPTTKYLDAWIPSTRVLISSFRRRRQKGRIYWFRKSHRSVDHMSRWDLWMRQSLRRIRFQ